MQKASLPAAVRPGIFYRVLERKLRPNALVEKALLRKSSGPKKLWPKKVSLRSCATIGVTTPRQLSKQTLTIEPPD
jgi:hypothetical protein